MNPSSWLVKLLIEEGYGQNAATALAEKIIERIPAKAVTEAALATALDQHKRGAEPIALARNVVQTTLCMLSEVA